MERIKTIIKSGVRNINLVAPDKRCTSIFRNELQHYKGLNVAEAPRGRRDAAWCDLVVFNDRDEKLVRDHALLDVIYHLDLSGQLALALYNELCELGGESVPAKALMKKYDLGSWKHTRDVLAGYADCPLFFPLDDNDGHLHLVPYYYRGREPWLLVVRHLLELGYTVSRRDGLIHASLGCLSLTVGFDIEELAVCSLPGILILISPKAPVVNFCGIRSCTLKQFLTSKQLI